ncbi:MAG: cation:proton antiporter [Traorella sp.]
MEVLAWIRFILGAFLIVCALLIFIIEVIGLYRFNYVLNRMHAAAMGDTLGLTLAFLGLILINGFNFASIKLLILIIFFWFASPTSSHLITNFEIITDDDEIMHYELHELDEIESEAKDHE